MKILVINPIGDDSWDESDRRFFQNIASSTTKIDVVSLGSGPPSVETIRDYEAVRPIVIDLALKMYREYDGLIVNCFLDPGVQELKNLINRPVVGPGESSLAFGSIFGGRLGIVSIESEALKLIEEKCSILGYGERIISIRGIKTHVVDLARDWDRVKMELVEESRRAVRDGAEVIILGCTGLAGLSKWVSEAVSKPVIDPAAAALKMIESIVSLGLRRME
ncbi:MAG: aspartate/glutamate racemase family protein [Nitrososphaerota archaeon]